MGWGTEAEAELSRELKRKCKHVIDFEEPA